MPNRFILFCCFICSFGFSFSQTPRYFHYTVEQGLPSSETYEVIQDSKGFIWIGTDRGVARYNGYEFKIFTTNDGLPSNTVFRIIEGQEGRIWFFSFNSQVVYYKDNKIYPYKYNHVLQQHLQGTPHPRSIHFDKDSGIYIGYEFQGLVHIDRKGNFRQLISPEEDHGAIGFVKEVEGTPLHGTFWKSTMLNRPWLFILDYRGKKIRITDRQMLGDIYHTVNIKRKNGSLITATSKCLIECTSTGKLCTTKLHRLINRLYEDRNNCLWVGLAKGGVKKLSPHSSDFQNFQLHLLHNQSVTGVLHDAEGGYWFATLESGVYYFPQFNILDVRTPMSQQAREIYSITGDGRNTIFIGYDTGMIEEMEGVSFKRTINVPVKRKPVANYPFCRMVTLAYDKGAGKLYCGHDQGFSCFDEKGIENKADGYTSASFVTGTDECLFSTGSYLRRYHKGNISYHNLGPVSLRIEAIYQNPQGKIYLGTSTGLYLLDHKKLYQPDNFLKETRITEIKSPAKGKMVYATLGKGLVVEQNGNLQVIDEKKDLASNLVNGISNDNDTIWVATTKGISRLVMRGDGIVINNFDQYNGLPTNEVKKIYQQGNIVWLGTKKGLYWFDSKKIVINHEGPKVFLDKILVNDKQVQTNAFSPGENNLSFHFFAINYKKRGNIRYRYRLIGHDHQWHYTHNRSVQYLSLPYGEYRFEVQAENEDHYWSKNSTVFSFTVAKPFYLEWWFIAVCIFLITATVYLIVRRRITTIRHNNKVILLMNEYKGIALASQINPHFIFNSLNSIQSFIIHEDRVTAAKYLSSFARLMRRSLEHSRIDFVSVRNEMELLEMYLSLEELRFKNKFTHWFEIDQAIDQDNTYIPAMIFQPFIENSIKHGLIPRQENKGSVVIRLTIEKQWLRCEIDDNGVGRNKTAVSTTETLVHRSHGIDITVERIKTYCKNEKCVFYFEIEDKLVDNEEKAGTKVIFCLPYRKENHETKVPHHR